MTGTIVFVVLLALAVPPAHSSQAPRGAMRTVTVIMAGPALAGGAAQEGLLLGVSWVDFADQLFPRQNVRVRIDYFWRTEKVVPVVEDARERGFDLERAKFLLASAGFFERRPRFTVIADLNRPEAKRAAYWLREQLQRLGLFVDDNIKDDGQTKLEDETSDAVLLVRAGK